MEKVNRIRDMLSIAGWSMIGKTSKEYWSDGDRTLAITMDEVFVYSPVFCVMSVDDFLSSGGKGVLV